MGAMTSWNEAEELRRDALGKEIDKSTRYSIRQATSMATLSMSAFQFKVDMARA
jgi:hypothetical protein